MGAITRKRQTRLSRNKVLLISETDGLVPRTDFAPPQGSVRSKEELSASSLAHKWGVDVYTLSRDIKGGADVSSRLNYEAWRKQALGTRYAALTKPSSGTAFAFALSTGLKQEAVRMHWNNGAPKTSVGEFLSWLKLKQLQRVQLSCWSKRKRLLDAKRRNQINADKISQQRKQRHLKNPEKERARARAKMKRFRSTFHGKLTSVLRNSLRDALLGRRGGKKVDATIKLLGISIEQFKDYLALQFTRGMTRENYGTVWHIDHIRPISSFDLSDESQQRKCFHYTNMRPLLARENLKKGAKMITRPHQIAMPLCLK